MSIKGKKSKDMVLLYDKEEAQPWMEYVKKCFMEEKSDLKIRTEDIVSNLTNISSLCSEAAIVCLVLSPAFVELMITEEESMKPCLCPCVVTVIELFIEEGQFESDIASRYSVDKWKRFSIGGEESENKQVAKEIVNIITETSKSDAFISNLSKAIQGRNTQIQNSQVQTQKPQDQTQKPHSQTQQPHSQTQTQQDQPKKPQNVLKTAPKPTTKNQTIVEKDIDTADSVTGEVTNVTPAENGTTKSPREKEKAVRDKVREKTTPQHTSGKSILKDVCPDCIRRANEKVVLAFRREIPEGDLVQVEIEKQLYDTKRLNPYCYTFQAPAHTAGKVEVRLYLNGTKACKRIIHYLSPSNLAYTCPQFLQELLGLSDLNSLDRQLATMFTSSIAQDECMAHIFTPKNLITATGQQKSSDMLPTLLHFACYYGLQQLCMTITDFPGAFYAIQTMNVEGKTPIELAKEQDFEEIVQFLDTFSEMQNYMEHLEDIYEKMSGGKVLNTDGYMYMRGSKGLDDYEYGRIPSSASEDLGESDYVMTGAKDDTYEIKLNRPGQVEEVDEEDDLKEDAMTPGASSAPTRPPRPDRDDTVFENDMHLPHNRRPKRPPRTFDVKDTLCRDDDMQTPDYSLPKRPPKRFTMKDPMIGDDDIEPPDYQAPKRPPKMDMKDPMFGEPIPQSQPKSSLGSSTLDELRDLQESYKQGDLTMNDIEILYKAWQQRNNGCTSSSIKERQTKMQQMKNQHMKAFNKAEENKKTGFLKRLTQKKSPSPVCNTIQHNVIPNNYDSWNTMRVRTPTNNRDSTTSTSSMSSISSSSSSSSRGSHLGQTREEDEEEDTPTPPPRPIRTLRPSRLPTPPTSQYSSYTPRIPPRK